MKRPGQILVGGLLALGTYAGLSAVQMCRHVKAVDKVVARIIVDQNFISNKYNPLQKRQHQVDVLIGDMDTLSSMANDYDVRALHRVILNSDEPGYIATKTGITDPKKIKVLQESFDRVEIKNIMLHRDSVVGDAKSFAATFVRKISYHPQNFSR